MGVVSGVSAVVTGELGTSEVSVGVGVSGGDVTAASVSVVVVVSASVVGDENKGRVAGVDSVVGEAICKPSKFSQLSVNPVDSLLTVSEGPDLDSGVYEEEIIEVVLEDA